MNSRHSLNQMARYRSGEQWGGDGHADFAIRRSSDYLNPILDPFRRAATASRLDVYPPSWMAGRLQFEWHIGCSPNSGAGHGGRRVPPAPAIREMLETSAARRARLGSSEARPSGWSVVALFATRASAAPRGASRPRPSSDARRMRCTCNGAVLGLPGCAAQVASSTL